MAKDVRRAQVLDIMNLDNSEELLLLPHEYEDMTYIPLDGENFGYFEQYSVINKSWCNRLFVSSVSEDCDGITYEALCTVGGSESMKECRHTHFFNGGYVFYMSYKHMGLMLDFLKTRYEMD